MNSKQEMEMMGGELVTADDLEAIPEAPPTRPADAFRPKDKSRSNPSDVYENGQLVAINDERFGFVKVPRTVRKKVDELLDISNANGVGPAQLAIIIKHRIRSR